MLQEHDDRLRIIRARTILDMLGERPATGRDLFRPLKGLDNAALLESGLLCCLGTDGLSSNTDLDVRQEAVFLRERLDVAPQALIRCLTVNGAAALGLAGYGRLEPGSRAVFSVLPESLSI